MKKLPLPNIEVNESFNKCVSGISDSNLKNRLLECLSEINEKTNDYIYKAKKGELFKVQPIKCKRGEDPIVVRNVKKSEFVMLYQEHMVPKDKPARVIYDKIKVAANGSCPFCGGIGNPKTLDHYLPIANYSQFSVAPINLIPACRDCNSEKSNRLSLSADSQVLHPYFDEDCFFLEQWVFARLEKTEPCLIDFFVMAPKHWSEIQKNRVIKHFEDFNLAERFSIKGGQELRFIIDTRTNGFTHDFPPVLFKKYLYSCATSSSQFINHWQKVLYLALSEDNWFCSNQF